MSEEQGSRLPFEARGYWHLEEVLDAVAPHEPERRRVRAWLTRAGAIDQTPTRGKVVVRVIVEETMPWLIETLRRIDALGDARRR